MFANMSFADWMSVPILIVGTIAAVAALGTWADARRRPRPEPTLVVEPMRSAPGWWRLTIGINNTTVTRWGAERLEVLRPRSARIVSMLNAVKPDAGGGHVFDAASADAAAGRAARLEMVAGVVGAYAPGGATGYRTTQRVSECVYLRADQTPPLSVEMRITLVSEELVQRKLRVKITRVLAAAPEWQR